MGEDEFFTQKNNQQQADSVEVTPQEKETIRRSLGFGAVFLITLNAIFASSLTYLPGLGAQMIGPGSILAWIGIFLLGIYLALCLSELISLFPQTGDVYVFAKKAFGHFTAFLVGWTGWIAGNIVASLSVVWALEYLWPVASLQAYLIKLAIGLGVIIVMNLIIMRGMKLTTVVTTFIAVLTVTVLILQIIPLFVNVPASIASSSIVSPFDATRFAPFFAHMGESVALSTSSILLFIVATMFIISEAFMGLESITFLSRETKDPQKTIPKALLTAISVAGVIMLLYVVGSFANLPLQDYVSSLLPHKDILLGTWHGTLQQLMLIGTGIIIFAPALAWVVTGPRLLRSLAEDKLFLKQLADTHPRFNTPSKAIHFQMIVISLLTAFVFYLYIMHHHDPYKLVHEIFILCMLFVLVVVSLTVPRFRKIMPDAPRLYKAPFGKIGPYLLALFFVLCAGVYFWITNEWHIILKSFTIMFTGVPVFLLLILYYNPDATHKTYNALAPVEKFFENINLPKRIRKKILSIAKVQPGDRAFEYGASVGTFTIDLAKTVGPQGSVTAVDFSTAGIRLIQQRIKKEGLYQITPIHDEFMVSRVHPNVPQVDVIFSVGSLDHVQNLEQVFQDMADLLPDQGRICLVEYCDFFGILPNAGWVKDLSRIQEACKKAGFAVRVEKWKAFAWNYVVIYGIKTQEDIVVV